MHDVSDIHDIPFNVDTGQVIIDELLLGVLVHQTGTGVKADDVHVTSFPLSFIHSDLS